MVKTTYFLIRFDVLDAKEDFEKMIGWLGGIKDVNTAILEKGEIGISYRNSPQATFKQTDFQMVKGSKPLSAMRVECVQTEFPLFSLIREMAGVFQYRVYNMNLGCFLPSDLSLYDVSQFIVKEKTAEVFNAKGFKPLFNYQNTYLYYAQLQSDKSIHIINPGMLKYFEEYDVEKEKTPEFSYQVAPKLVKFVAMDDEQLIPFDFYKYFAKSLKIVNYSSFNIWRVNRKVFVKPIIYEYNNGRQSYMSIASEKAAIHYADKIRKGENLDIALKRMLREELKLGNDYVRAKVNRNVGFDRDKEKRLTPLLFVSIYLDSIPNKEHLKEKSQRGWVSLKDVVQ
ncbi:hypothetical protein ISS85_02490 [Candidatus Microgenomates bacterium]|nr:hypothetical protein [Candidatus Microgenomates bacterium]